jgi:hypothetical protein
MCIQIISYLPTLDEGVDPEMYDVIESDFFISVQDLDSSCNSRPVDDASWKYLVGRCKRKRKTGKTHLSNSIDCMEEQANERE